MTLPSAHYLKDNVDYIAPSPSFPLPNELRALQGGAPAALPPAGVQQPAAK